MRGDQASGGAAAMHHKSDGRDPSSSRTVALAPAAARQIKGSLAKVVLSYVRRLLGEDAVAAVLAAAAGSRPAAGLEEAASWTSPAYILAIADAAAEMCGDPDIGRRSGEELMRMQQERGTVDFILATGSVEDALALSANAATKMSNGRVYQIDDAGPGHVRIVARYTTGADQHRFFCGQATGYFGAVPGAFGLTGVIAEVRCMCRGDEACVYEIRWSAPSGASGEQRDAGSRDRTHSFIERFEQLHLMATELASAKEVDVVLARIADRAGLAIDAPRYLLAVRASDDAELLIFHKGFEPDRVERFATRLLADEIIDGDTCVVADVASTTRLYGKFAASYPVGSTVTEMERRLLAAYARHAAAALEAVAALESARRDRDTATALLGLANALAEVGSREDVASRLAQAVPDVAGADVTGVWLWNELDECLELAGCHSREPSRVCTVPSSVHRTDLVGLAALIDNRAPRVLRLDRADPDVGALMQAIGVRSCAIVPITARGVFLGLVVAGFDDLGSGDTADKELLEKMRGLAGQAGTALDNAALLSRVTDQALHDALTGLPNRTLLEDRARLALDQRASTHHSLSLLFIDLDRFKHVNDTLGHAVGDQVICDAAMRLRACLRQGDTLARLGGDEFVAVLPMIGSDHAVAIAQRMITALREPFAAGGTSVAISCSVGIASAPDHGEDYLHLLRMADAAMYEAKRRDEGYAVHATAT